MHTSSRPSRAPRARDQVSTSRSTALHGAHSSSSGRRTSCCARGSSRACWWRPCHSRRAGWRGPRRCRSRTRTHPSRRTARAAGGDAEVSEKTQKDRGKVERRSCQPPRHSSMAAPPCPSETKCGSAPRPQETRTRLATGRQLATQRTSASALMATGPTLAITFMMAARKEGEREKGTDGVDKVPRGRWQQRSGTSGSACKVAIRLIKHERNTGAGGRHTANTQLRPQPGRQHTCGQHRPRTHPAAVAPHVALGIGPAHAPE